MKKGVSIVLAGIWLLSLAACAGGEDMAGRSRIDREDYSYYELADVSEAAESAPEARLQDLDVAIEEQQLFAQDGIRVTAHGIYGMSEGAVPDVVITVTVENTTGTACRLLVQGAAVNGFMIDASLELDAAAPDTAEAGQTTEGEIHLSGEGLQRSNITTPALIELRFSALDPDTAAALFVVDADAIATTAGSGFQQPVDTDGQPVLQQDDFLMVYKKTVFADAEGALRLRLYSQNGMSEDCLLSASVLTVNGQPVSWEDGLTGGIWAGKQAVQEILIPAALLGGTDIYAIQEITFTLRITDAPVGSQTPQTLYESGEITIQYS